MDIVSLRAFRTVAELGSFSRAADELHLAQPAVSQQIKRLERDLGMEVLQRSTRRVQLTPAGERLLPRALAILSEVERAQADLQMMDSGLAGRVAIGFVGTATYDLLPQMARSVRAELPGVELELYGEQLSPGLAEGLLSRRLDIAVMRDPAPDPALSVQELRSERLVAALPIDHPAAGRQRVRLAALQEDTFITYPSGHRSVTYEAVMQACRHVGFLPAEVVEVRETATLVAFVAAGMGVALVPEPVRSLAVEGVVYRSLADIDQRTELMLALRSERHPATVERVAKVIAATAAQDASPRTG